MTSSISEYFSRIAQKRKPSSTSSSDSSPVTEKIRQDKKRFFHEVSDSCEEESENEMATIQTILDEIKRQFQTLATRDDIQQLKSDVDKLTSQVMLRLDKLEGRCFDAEKEIDSLKSDLTSVRKENAEMKEQLSRQEQKILSVLSDQNDQQQYDHRWNLRVYNVEEKAGETADDCAKKCCRIFTDLIGVPTTEEDLEAAHRTGPTTTGKRRPIIVRFQSRKLKDKVLANRRKLKGKGVSVDEDLTAANYKLARDAYKHSYTLASWSSQGKVFAKLKNGKTVRIKYGADINELFKKEMPAGNR